MKADTQQAYSKSGFEVSLSCALSVCSRARAEAAARRATSRQEFAYLLQSRTLLHAVIETNVEFEGPTDRPITDHDDDEGPPRRAAPRREESLRRVESLAAAAGWSACPPACLSASSPGRPCLYSDSLLNERVNATICAPEFRNHTDSRASVSKLEIRTRAVRVG